LVGDLLAERWKMRAVVLQKALSRLFIPSKVLVMTRSSWKRRFALTLSLLCVSVLSTRASAQKESDPAKNLDWQIPNLKKKLPFEKEIPIQFVNSRSPEWAKLPGYWSSAQEQAVDPTTGALVERMVVKLKLPLGLTIPPTVPLENPMTARKWDLGRRLYFDPILSTDNQVACASCHEPTRGFTDQAQFSLGIGGARGGMNAPTVMNSAFHPFQFWDGRASSLEHQAQGPVQNTSEMCADDKVAWRDAVLRVRKNKGYAKEFLDIFGTEPTRDGIAKAIATYERTVLNGNSIQDRAEVVMRKRVVEEEGTDYSVKPADYEVVLKEAIAKKDTAALKALNIDPAKGGDLKKAAEQISHGKALFFGKARCTLCHVGENFTDGQFHNLGVGVKEGKLPAEHIGRIAQLPLGHKNLEMYGAFKTPILRGLVSTAPYMHDGSEKTLEEVIDLYDRGGNANEFLSPKMRDLIAEQKYTQSQASGTPYKGPKVFLFGADKRPIVPFQLHLTKEEKAALVMFMRSLEGEVDPYVMNASKDTTPITR